MMKKIILIFILLICSSIPSFPQLYGNLMIVTPILDCSVIVDGTSLEVNKGIASAEVYSGYHDVLVTLKNGHAIYDREVFVYGGRVNTISVFYDPKQIKEEKKEIIKEVRDWGEGWGLSLGIDNANYELNTGSSRAAYSLSPQFDLSYFYSRHMIWNMYFDFNASLLRSFGRFEDHVTSTEVTVYPVNFGLKFKTSDYFIFGISMNISFWAVKTSGTQPDIKPEPGGRIFMEIRPISSEFGVIFKNGYVNNTHIASNGIYYKYKIYF